MLKSLQLSKACKEKNVNKLKELLKSKVNVNAKDNTGYTPLHWTASMRLFDMMEILLNNNANPNIKDRQGFTPVDHLFRYYVAMEAFAKLAEVSECGTKPSFTKNKDNSYKFPKQTHEETIRFFQLLRKYHATDFDVDRVAQTCKKYGIPKIIEMLKKDGFKTISLKQRKANEKHIEEFIRKLLLKNGYLLEILNQSGPNEVDSNTYIIRDKKSGQIVKGPSNSEYGMNLFKLINFIKRSIKTDKA